MAVNIKVLNNLITVRVHSKNKSKALKQRKKMDMDGKCHYFLNNQGRRNVKKNLVRICLCSGYDLFTLIAIYQNKARTIPYVLVRSGGPVDSPHFACYTNLLTYLGTGSSYL
jgi:hypothetical protein